MQLGIFRRCTFALAFITVLGCNQARAQVRRPVTSDCPPGASTKETSLSERIVVAPPQAKTMTVAKISIIGPNAVRDGDNVIATTAEGHQFILRLTKGKVPEYLAVSKDGVERPVEAFRMQLRPRVLQATTAVTCWRCFVDKDGNRHCVEIPCPEGTRPWPGRTISAAALRAVEIKKMEIKKDKIENLVGCTSLGVGGERCVTRNGIVYYCDKQGECECVENCDREPKR